MYEFEKVMLKVNLKFLCGPIFLCLLEIYWDREISKLFSSIASKPILSHTEKSCIASYYRQFSTNYIIQNWLQSFIFFSF